MYKFLCMEAASSADSYLLLHQRTEIWGFQGHLVIGVVSHHHNNVAEAYE